MLPMRLSSECRKKGLPTDAINATNARIGAFECTFCNGCNGCTNPRVVAVCPHSRRRQRLLQRPCRPASDLAKYPAPAERVLKPSGYGVVA